MRVGYFPRLNVINTTGANKVSNPVELVRLTPFLTQEYDNYQKTIVEHLNGYLNAIKCDYPHLFERIVPPGLKCTLNNVSQVLKILERLDPLKYHNILVDQLRNLLTSEGNENGIDYGFMFPKTTIFTHSGTSIESNNPVMIYISKLQSPDDRYPVNFFIVNQYVNLENFKELGSKHILFSLYNKIPAPDNRLVGIEPYSDDHNNIEEIAKSNAAWAYKIFNRFIKHGETNNFVMLCAYGVNRSTTLVVACLIFIKLWGVLNELYNHSRSEYRQFLSSTPEQKKPFLTALTNSIRLGIICSSFINAGIGLKAHPDNNELDFYIALEIVKLINIGESNLRSKY